MNLREAILFVERVCEWRIVDIPGALQWLYVPRCYHHRTTTSTKLLDPTLHDC